MALKPSRLRQGVFAMVRGLRVWRTTHSSSISLKTACSAITNFCASLSVSARGPPRPPAIAAM